MLFATNITNETKLDDNLLAIFKKKYEILLAKVSYDSGPVLDWCNRFIRDDQLVCPLDAAPIRFHSNISGLPTNTKDHNYMQVCHNEAASKKKYFQDKTTNIFMSDCRSNNLFWGTHQGNMEQQDMTINEYHCHIRSKAMRFEEHYPVDN